MLLNTGERSYTDISQFPGCCDTYLLSPGGQCWATIPVRGMPAVITDNPQPRFPNTTEVPFSFRWLSKWGSCVVVALPIAVIQGLCCLPSCGSPLSMDGPKVALGSFSLPSRGRWEEYREHRPWTFLGAIARCDAQLPDHTLLGRPQVHSTPQVREWGTIV